jgi:hypothetical protein
MAASLFGIVMASVYIHTAFKKDCTIDPKTKTCKSSCKKVAADAYDKAVEVVDTTGKSNFTESYPFDLEPNGIIDTTFRLSAFDASKEVTDGLPTSTQGNQRLRKSFDYDKVDNTEFASEMQQMNLLARNTFKPEDDMTLVYNPSRRSTQVAKGAAVGAAKGAAVGSSKSTFEGGRMRQIGDIESWMAATHSAQDDLGPSGDAQQYSLDEYKKGIANSVQMQFEPYPSISEMKMKTPIVKRNWQDQLHNRMSSTTDQRMIQHDRWRNRPNKAVDAYHRSRYSDKLRRHYEEELDTLEKKQWW